MNSNYNDIIDIILTLTDDEDISNNIAISGSIVPYLVTNKESLEYHSDFYILVKSKKIDLVRDKVRKLTKEYEFDFVSDSKRYSKTYIQSDFLNRLDSTRLEILLPLLLLQHRPRLRMKLTTPTQ